ncbi:MAG: ImmA/IrrE family metallo-endopeptidase [Dethiobacter sp.]|jgi:HTH-type transcriptional regulator/antitoxin HigA|nr:MAG: ImmA/IrrE family metallo-endopeptidase [Dethiobacter sp.]
MNGYLDELIIPPGETIKEMLEDRSMTQEELAIRLKMSTKHVNQMITGKKPITYQTALKLESVFNVPASFWNNLERIYREKIVRFEQDQEIAEELGILPEIPFKQLVDYGYINPATKPKDKVLAVRSFLGVANLKCIDTLMEQLVFRKSGKVKCSTYTLACWVRMCEIETSKIDVDSFSKDKLRKYLPEIRDLVGTDPKMFILKLTGIFSDCGIAFCVLKNLKKAPVQGMTRHLNERVILGMTIRGKNADIFWFSLFHEIGHILLHSKKDIFIDFETGNYGSQKETEADEFAAKTLIPEAAYKSFIKNASISASKVKAFAKSIDLHPCILVGRLQREGLARYNDKV